MRKPLVVQQNQIFDRNENYNKPLISLFEHLHARISGLEARLIQVVLCDCVWNLNEKRQHFTPFPDAQLE